MQKKNLDLLLQMFNPVSGKFSSESSHLLFFCTTCIVDLGVDPQSSAVHSGSDFIVALK